MSAHCRGGSRTARARTLAFFVSNYVSLISIGVTQLPKKSRVRTRPSESIVGLENLRSLRPSRGQGATVPCGVWGGTPQKPSNCVSPIKKKEKLQGHAFVQDSGVVLGVLRGGPRIRHVGQKARCVVRRGKAIQLCGAQKNLL